MLAFFSGWTFRLHTDGYISGVYGSASSTPSSDLVTKYHSKYREPNDIWIADWNGRKDHPRSVRPRRRVVTSPALAPIQRATTTRATAGVTLNVDDDFLNGATANARNGYMLLTSNGGIHLFGPIRGHGSDVGKLPPGVTAVALARDQQDGRLLDPAGQTAA